MLGTSCHCCCYIPSLSYCISPKCEHTCGAQSVWQEVLRCVSRWDLLATAAAGGPSDARLFSPTTELPKDGRRRPFFALRSGREGGADCALLQCPSAMPSLLLMSSSGCQSRSLPELDPSTAVHLQGLSSTISSRLQGQVQQCEMAGC